MNKVFADTSGWANFFIRTEPFHTNAKHLMRQWHTNQIHIVTTNYVLAELIALLTSPLRIPRKQAIKVVETIKTASWVEIIHVDAILDEAAWILLKERQDKTWSLVDCASFIIMRHQGITQTFTSDHHFEQAGFLCVLK